MTLMSMYAYPVYSLCTMVLPWCHGTVELPRYTLPSNLGPPFGGLRNVKMVCLTKSTRADVGSGYSIGE